MPRNPSTEMLGRPFRSFRNHWGTAIDRYDNGTGRDLPWMLAMAALAAMFGACATEESPGTSAATMDSGAPISDLQLAGGSDVDGPLTSTEIEIEAGASSDASSGASQYNRGSGRKRIVVAFIVGDRPPSSGCPCLATYIGSGKLVTASDCVTKRIPYKVNFMGCVYNSANAIPVTGIGVSPSERGIALVTITGSPGAPSMPNATRIIDVRTFDTALTNSWASVTFREYAGDGNNSDIIVKTDGRCPTLGAPLFENADREIFYGLYTGLYCGNGLARFISVAGHATVFQAGGLKPIGT